MNVGRAEAVSSCPVCASTRLRSSFSRPGLSVARCAECGHRSALHRSTAGGDFYERLYEQSDQAGFLEALRATRVRQADRILARLRRHLPANAGLLDVGCGRGWFLDRALAKGFAPVAGADASSVAVRLLRERRIPAVQVEVPLRNASAFAELPFRPRMVTLLDVVEHFSPEGLRAGLKGLLDALGPDLEWVLVKVPVSSGVLFRTASLLSRVGAPGALEQLYQVGTEPPHHHYFSPRSLRRLLEGCGLRIVDRLFDRDFEPANLASRAGALRKMGVLARALGAGAGLLAGIGLQDSLALLARCGP